MTTVKLYLDSPVFQGMQRVSSNQDDTMSTAALRAATPRLDCSASLQEHKSPQNYQPDEIRTTASIIKPLAPTTVNKPVTPPLTDGFTQATVRTPATKSMLSADSYKTLCQPHSPDTSKAQPTTPQSTQSSARLYNPAQSEHTVKVGAPVVNTLLHATAHLSHIVQRAAPLLLGTVTIPRAVFTKFSRRNKKVAARHNLLSSIFMGFALIVLCGGTYVVIDSYRTNRYVTAQTNAIVSELAHENTVLRPSTTPSSAAVAAQTPPALPADQPTSITFERLGINAAIKPAGLDKDGAIGVPANTNDVGWYTGSGTPGGPGTAVLVGHVSGYTSAGGVFLNLKKAQKNDTLRITMGDGRTVEYTVRNTQRFAKDAVDMNAAITSVEPGKPGLNIITCAGKYDAKAKTFSERLVVYATLK